MTLLLLSSLGAFAQYTYFPNSGVIHYEKTVHVKNYLRTYNSLSKDDNYDKDIINELINKAPTTYVYKSKLSFDGEQSRYEPIKEDLPAIMRNLSWYRFDLGGSYYQDLKNKTMSSVSDFAGIDLRIQDDLLPVKWKVTNEFREIAGYNCRRANGVVMDSVYVVAFYTDDIPLSVGPGALHGLPGMILGLSIPDRHTNIYATKVEFSQPSVSPLAQKKKDKNLKRGEINNLLRERFNVGEWFTEKQFSFNLISIFL